jgi:hypothetical protein
VVNGIHMTLMIGPAVPVPVPESVLDALVSVQVVEQSGSTQSGFELVFTLSNDSLLQTIFLLAGGASIPLVRVVIVVTIGGNANIIMDGVMTDHQLTPGTADGHSTLTIRGKDLSEIMGYIDFSGIPYPAMPREARVALVVAKYAVLGLVPFVVPSILLDVPLPIDSIPRHQGKDLAYVRQLADEVGYTFYVQPGSTPGMSIAYWGPEIRVGVPQPALNINMDAETNIESLDFRFDKSTKILPVVIVQEPITKVPIPIPIPDITPLSPPLGAITPMPPHVEFLSWPAKYSPLQGIVIGLTKAAQSSDCVFGNGRLDVLRYGRLLQSRQLVGVRGAGPAFDGLHYVKQVTHNIKRGEYKQSFSLARNGLLSTLPQVPA